MHALVAMIKRRCVVKGGTMVQLAITGAFYACSMAPLERVLLYSVWRPVYVIAIAGQLRPPNLHNIC